VKQKLNRLGSIELQQNSLYQVTVGVHRVGASELKGLESLGVDAPKCRTIALAKESWCSRGWSLTKVQVGAWQLIATIYILYLFIALFVLIKAFIPAIYFFVPYTNVLVIKKNN